MSEIPFVNRLGDAIDIAIARPAPARRRIRLPRRRYLAVALAAVAVAGGGAAIAGILHDPVEIGFGAVGCFEGTEPDGNVAVITDPTKSPVQLCAAALPNDGLEASDLLACAWDGHGIVVVKRGDRGTCTARGLAPVPAAYTLGRKRAARLQAVAVGFDRSAGCLAPSDFARRLTARLHARGWVRWRAIARGGEGPCGRVSLATGSSIVGSIAGAVDGARRTIAVQGRAPLGLERMLLQPGSPGERLFGTSGARCFTVARLERHIRHVLGPARTPIRFRVTSMRDFVELMGPRGARYAEGCAVFAAAGTAFPGGHVEVVIDLLQRDAPQSP
jgi:hypothetical protein